jgi:integrase
MSHRKRPGLKLRGRLWHVEIAHCGKRVRQSLGTDDKKQAERLYDRIRAELWEEARLDKKPEPTWDEAALAYVRKFERLVREGKRRATSLDRRRFAMLTEKLRGVPLSQITRNYVIEQFGEQRAQNMNSSLISTVLNTAVEEGMLTSAPSVIFGSLNERTRYLNSDEARQLLSQAGYLHDAALFSLATGLRQENVMRLRWDWIKDRAVIVPKEHFKQKREHAQPLNRTAMAVIKRQIGKHSGYVFVRDGAPFQLKHHPLEDAVRWDYQWKLARKGITDFRWHDLRHTWASQSLQAGVPEPMVEALGGWRSGKMVRRYAHTSVEFLRPFAEMLDPWLASVQGEVAPQIPHSGSRAIVAEAG